jgi:CheY-like chemotaxis protein
MADIPVIVVSAYKDVEARARALGAVQWLAKPFDLTALLRLVEQNCDAAG